jgi:predicted DNA-binding transcriptional regulator AlpA
MSEHRKNVSEETPLKPLLTYREQLQKIYGINYSNSTLLRKEAAGDFPQRVRLSLTRVAWRTADIENYLATLATGAGQDVITHRIAAKHARRVA